MSQKDKLYFQLCENPLMYLKHVTDMISGSYYKNVTTSHAMRRRNSESIRTESVPGRWLISSRILSNWMITVGRKLKMAEERYKEQEFGFSF